MKLHWGHKLTFFVSLFILFIIFLVYKISVQKIDLVDKNYYEKGIKYQDEINKFSEAKVVQPKIEFDLAKQLITFTANDSTIKGTLHFYRSADADKDFEVPFQLTNNQFIYSTQSIQAGIWHITFEWVLNGKLMAIEKQLVL
ncbi:MAG: FixH family protein [Bacteroidia bacterium]|nr:FixH family protein [Bacteroidia bacterium]